MKNIERARQRGETRTVGISHNKVRAYLNIHPDMVVLDVDLDLCTRFTSLVTVEVFLKFELLYIYI